MSCCDGLLAIFIGSIGNGLEQFAGGRVKDIEGLAIGGITPNSVDVKTGWN